ncbi:helix-turn-helix transcriptional regulator [Bacillus sp. JJ1122]|uniref:helix-turn-helix transcriptional regulator n=1 Tax=Bacillus sp. JJ1122 TaxID=3122951 RepID=UPI003000DA55
MKTQIPRHNDIGEKIRAKRKEKGITLGELAKGICSVGKMSNIENGHIPISAEDLKLISEKLNTSSNFFSDPYIENKIQELDYQKQKINDLISLQNWIGAKSELQSFEKKIKEYDIPSRDIDYIFLTGLLSLKTNQQPKAEKSFQRVIDSNESNNYILKLKLRAYNALASIGFSDKKVSKSTALLERALELSKESPTITKEERDNIFYNLSILNLYIGSLPKALKSINSVNHYLISPIETEYIKILIRFLENTSSTEVRKDLLSLREKLHQINNHEGIIRGWALTVYTLMTSLPKENLIAKLKQPFWSDTEMISQIDSLKETSLSLFQLGIYVSLTKNIDSRIIHEMFNKTKPLLLQTDNPLLHARNYYLEGKFYKEVQKDSTHALELFQTALETLDDWYEGLLKADILFEICKIKSVESDALIALELYHSHLENQFLFSHFHDLSMPSFKY